MHRLLGTVLTLCGLACAGSVVAGDADAVKADVRKISSAVFGSDVDTVLSYTYPPIIELLGGDAAARRAMQDAISSFESTGMRLESTTFPEEPRFIAGTAHEYVIVPTDSIMAANGQKVRSLNFQFGVRRNGESKWFYIEGSRVTPEMLAAWFPDFPSDYSFPIVSRERM